MLRLAVVASRRHCRGGVNEILGFPLGFLMTVNILRFIPRGVVLENMLTCSFVVYLDACLPGVMVRNGECLTIQVVSDTIMH
jgi:hypothetical protein